MHACKKNTVYYYICFPKYCILTYFGWYHSGTYSGYHLPLCHAILEKFKLSVNIELFQWDRNNYIYKITFRPSAHQRTGKGKKGRQ